MFVTDRDVPSATARAAVTELIASMPASERRVVLYYTRRVCGLGLQEYGALDLATDKRDFDAETLAEFADAVFYQSIAVMKGRGRPAMLDKTIVMMRELTADSMRREAI